MTRILLCGDLHIGHKLGLTPEHRIDPEFKLSEIMTGFWRWWEQETAGTWDIAFWNGDIIDGEGKKDNSSTWLDIKGQKDTAIGIIETLKASRNIFTYGTGYHVGTNQDYEEEIAEHFLESIKTVQEISIEGIKFNISHAISKSSTPTGGDIALKKELLWDYLTDGQADFIIKSHIHEYRRLENAFCTVITLPALQIAAPDHYRYARSLRGFYNVGFVEIVIDKGKVIDFVKHFYFYKISKGYEEIGNNKNYDQQYKYTSGVA